MSDYDNLKIELLHSPRTWLVTGCAGFIGSNLLETLLRLDQAVVGLDNFSTGKPGNMEEVKTLVMPQQWGRFKFIEGDIRSLDTCQQAAQGVDCILHQAALGSVPRSIEDPLRSHESNVNGFLNLLVAARDHRVKRLVYASSSSVYGDQPDLPKREDKIGSPLSPYAVTKRINELYAKVFARCYGLETIGLRYFNVFGPRQDPEGPYAAVIPKWIAAMLKGDPIYINGDGETSRDFCFVENTVQANLLAAMTSHPEAANQVYNVALNERTTLNELFSLLRGKLSSALCPPTSIPSPIYRPFRPGDVRHSQADVSEAQRLLAYQPTHTLAQGLDGALEWYRTSATETGGPSGEVGGKTCQCLPTG